MNEANGKVRVWDPLVRIMHWVLVTAFFTAWLTEDDFMNLHVGAGYVVAAVVVLRVAWGFVGTRHARFADFVRSPRTTVRYLRDLGRGRAQRYVGHNPAGAAMIVALLLAITATGVSGLALYAIEEQAGPLAGWFAAPAVTAGQVGDPGDGDERGHAEDSREELWEEIHEIAANLSLLLVAVHVAGVLFSSFLHRENLVAAMLTGRKRAGDAPQA